MPARVCGWGSGRGPVLSILDRYFLRELAYSIAATAIVLLVILAGGTFARVLSQVANGSFPPGIMFQVLGLRMVDALSGMLPLGAFLGTLAALGRMYRESEMHVLASSGMGAKGLVKPVTVLAALVAVVVGTVAIWLGPLASSTSDQMIANANRSVIAAGLDAGRFTTLPGKGGVIFVDTLSRDGSKLGHTFLAKDVITSKGVHEVRLVTANNGQMYQESDGDGRFIALYTGWQYEIPLLGDNWRRMHFERNDSSLSSVQADDDDDDDPVHSMSFAALGKANSNDARAEIAWRIAAPVTALVLLMLALPLSRQSPREARYGRLLIAVLAYFLYLAVMQVIRTQIVKGSLHTSAPMWIIHTLVFAVSAWFFAKQYAPRRVRKPVKAVTA
jgi:lipopolysaccharide export system permease protein